MIPEIAVTAAAAARRVTSEESVRFLEKLGGSHITHAAYATPAWAQRDSLSYQEARRLGFLLEEDETPG